jgi:hypothetical protein
LPVANGWIAAFRLRIVLYAPDRLAAAPLWALYGLFYEQFHIYFNMLRWIPLPPRSGASIVGGLRTARAWRRPTASSCVDLHSLFQRKSIQGAASCYEPRLNRDLTNEMLGPSKSTAKSSLKQKLHRNGANWARLFVRPIRLNDGTILFTLKDAAERILELPAAPSSRVAAERIMDAALRDGEMAPALAAVRLALLKSK